MKCIQTKISVFASVLTPFILSSCGAFEKKINNKAKIDQVEAKQNEKNNELESRDNSISEDLTIKEQSLSSKIKSEAAARQEQDSAITTQATSDKAELKGDLSTEAQSRTDGDVANLAKINDVETKQGIKNTELDSRDNQIEESVETNVNNIYDSVSSVNEKLETKIAKETEERVKADDKNAEELRLAKVEQGKVNEELKAKDTKIEEDFTAKDTELADLVKGNKEDADAKFEAERKARIEADEKNAEELRLAKVSFNDELLKLNTKIGTEAQRVIDEAKAEDAKLLESINKNIETAKTELADSIAELRKSSDGKFEALEKGLKDLNEKSEASAKASADQIQALEATDKASKEEIAGLKEDLEQVTKEIEAAQKLIQDLQVAQLKEAIGINAEDAAKASQEVLAKIEDAIQEFNDSVGRLMDGSYVIERAKMNSKMFSESEKAVLKTRILEVQSENSELASRAAERAVEFAAYKALGVNSVVAAFKAVVDERK